MRTWSTTLWSSPSMPSCTCGPSEGKQGDSVKKAGKTTALYFNVAAESSFIIEARASTISAFLSTSVLCAARALRVFFRILAFIRPYFSISSSTSLNSSGEMRPSRSAFEITSVMLLSFDRARTRISSCFLAFTRSRREMYLPAIPVLIWCR